MELALSIIAFVAYLSCCCAIIQKAGYSGWWILVALVPLVNVLMFMIFALSRWPVQCELSLQRVIAGNGRDSDFDSVVVQAMAADRRGNWIEALHLFELLQATCGDKPTMGYLVDFINELKAKLGTQQIPPNPYVGAR